MTHMDGEDTIEEINTGAAVESGRAGAPTAMTMGSRSRPQRGN